MTAEEIKVIEHLASAFNHFTQLPNKHPSDDVEFSHHIHILQRHVMCRIARRENPELFKFGSMPDSVSDLEEQE